MYTYRCIVRRTVDGDTIACDIDKGFGDWGHADDPACKNHLRIFGIDTPETRRREPGMSDTEWMEEKVAGKKATERMVPTGLAIPFPAISGADPWMGS